MRSQQNDTIRAIGITPGRHQCWPKKRLHRNERGSSPRVFVLGRLVIDSVFSLVCTLQDLADAAVEEEEKIPCEWTKCIRVGGFPAWAVRATRKLEGQVWLSTVLPVPLPKEFSKFFEAWDVNTMYCTVFPGLPAATLHFSCKDGHRLFTRAGMGNVAAPFVPAGIFQDFDLILVKPGVLPARRSVLRRLRKAGRSRDARPVTALVLGSDYTLHDLELLRDESSFYAFCNGREALSIGGRLTGNTVTNVEEAAAAMKSALGSTRLCVSLGRAGAILLNGKTTHFSPIDRPVDTKDTAGAGDRLATLTASQIANGVDEVKALDCAVTTLAAELAN